MPGIPCIYYGSEWGEKAQKQQGSDANLRPCFDEPQTNELTEWIAKLAKAKKSSKALCYGGYTISRIPQTLTQKQAAPATSSPEKCMISAAVPSFRHTTPRSGRYFNFSANK